MIRNFTICFVLSISCLLSARATVVVILRDEEKIIVAADSRRHFLDVVNNGKGDYMDDSWCKIRRAGKFYYTLGGYDDLLQIETATDASKRAKNLTEFADIFNKTIGSAYNKKLQAYKSLYPDQFARKFHKEEIFAEVALFTFESGKPKLVTCYYRMSITPNSPVDVQGFVERNKAVTVLGFSDHFRAMPKNVIPYYQKLHDNNPVEFVKAIVDMEKKHHPKIIGGPTDILQLSVLGERWFQRKKKC